jgi:hypothetical protein
MNFELSHHTNKIDILAKYSREHISPHISKSIHLYDIADSSADSSNMLTTILQVSKTHQHPKIYDFIELLNFFPFCIAHKCNIGLYTLYNEELIRYIKICRPFTADCSHSFNLNEKKFTHSEIEKFNKSNSLAKNSMELLIFDIPSPEKLNDYVCLNIGIIMNIINQQSIGGTSIIKIDNLSYKPILDIIYILNFFYKKIAIVNTFANSEKYLICMNYINSDVSYLQGMETILKTVTADHISSVISENLPLLFLNKIDEYLIIMHMQQLLISDCKSKPDKMDTYKKTSIHQSIKWCEKHKIPHNKCLDKVNMFLATRSQPANEITENIFLKPS